MIRYCSGCGTEVDNRTIGCYQCMWRHNKRSETKHRKDAINILRRKNRARKRREEVEAIYSKNET